LLSALIVIVVVTVMVLPVAKRAIKEFGLPLRYQDTIRQQASAKHLDAALIAGVIYAETKFDPRPSTAGAEGPMQLLPQTARFLARRSGGTMFRVTDLNSPQVNIAYGSYYLRYLLNEFRGSTVAALAAYNGGEANVARWIARDTAAGKRLTIASIPFPETQAYVVRVLHARAEYRHTYASELGYR
jgi:soluble lytic murein transglycosylase